MVGAFRGRPGGLVLLGIVAATTLAVSSVTGGFSAATSRTYDPTTTSEVRPAYTMQNGELVLNLSDLDALDALGGREIDIDGNAGEVVVIVPRGLSVDVDAQVSALGGIDIGPDATAGGFDLALSRTLSGAAGSPVLDLEVDLRFGHIEVRNDNE